MPVGRVIGMKIWYDDFKVVIGSQESVGTKEVLDRDNPIEWEAASYFTVQELRIENGIKYAWNSSLHDGVIAVMVYYDDHVGERNRRVGMSGAEWYFSDGDQMFGYSNDPIEELKKRYPEAVFKRGKWTSLQDYVSITEACWADWELP